MRGVGSCSLPSVQVYGRGLLALLNFGLEWPSPNPRSWERGHSSLQINKKNAEVGLGCQSERCTTGTRQIN